MNGSLDITGPDGNGTRELKLLAGFAAVFALFYFLPVGVPRFDQALLEGLHLTQWYAREHVLLCLVPALFIAGGISTFVSQASVMRYLGPKASKPKAYAVASVSGTILAVCSCTVLPLFGGIWTRGAGLGPAIAFLYAGPAVNVLAIVLTARVLGLELGVARAAGAIAFSILVGLAMHLVFRREEQVRAEAAVALPDAEAGRPLGQTIMFFACLAGVLVFANWGAPAGNTGFWQAIHSWKWPLTAAFGAGLALTLGLWFGFKWKHLILAGALVTLLGGLFPKTPALPFLVGCAALVVLCVLNPAEGRPWLEATWALGRQIFPLLIIGVFVSGVLLGRPNHEGLMPSNWVSQSVGGNSLAANLAAAVVGAFMYFATLTEVPILQGLIGAGMGQGPALALLLAGPALSLPSMLVLRSLMGTKKTVVYVMLVIVMATVSGSIYGTWF